MELNMISLHLLCKVSALRKDQILYNTYKYTCVCLYVVQYTAYVLYVVYPVVVILTICAFPALRSRCLASDAAICHT